MKNLFLIAAVTLFSAVLISFSPAKTSTICDDNGKLLMEKSVLIQAFNSISVDQAEDLKFSYDAENETHSLLFAYKAKSGGLAFELEKNGKGYALKAAASSVSHSCSGAPCSQCEMSSTFFTVVNCTCTQEDCPQDCKCNHTVTKGIANLDGDDLEKAIN